MNLLTLLPPRTPRSVRAPRSVHAWPTYALRIIVALTVASWLGPVAAMDESAPQRRPVKTVAPERLKIKTALGEALVPAYASGDLSKVQPQIKRAVIVVHGRLRDADKYFDLSMRAAKASNALTDTLVIAPQILINADTARNDLGPSLARWKSEAWLGGDVGKAPFAISSFEVLDGMIALLSDRTRFPNLERIVVAAHSGGAQFVQRYAVVGRADQVLAGAGLQPYADGLEAGAATVAGMGSGSGAGAVKSNVMRVRYVVANPSSYVYFDSTRPKPVEKCAEFDHWRYGWVEPVAYVRGDAKAMEQRYLTRRVIYLSGGSDTDPNHAAIDKSCMAETQGANRLERGVHYFAHVQKRAKLYGTALRHTRIEVPGVAHDADRMFNSVCGMSALFDAPGCELKLGESSVAPSGAALSAASGAALSPPSGAALFSLPQTTISATGSASASGPATGFATGSATPAGAARLPALAAPPHSSAKP